MKKITLKKVSAALLAGAMLGLTACGSSTDTTAAAPAEPAAAETTETAPEAAPEAAADDQLARILAKGEVVIAMEGNWAPWTYHDDTDELVGYDTEVGKAIAEKLGVNATFVEGEWDGLLAGLDAGRYDMVINGVDVTDDRKEQYDFTDAYAFIRTALVVAEDNTDITSFEDLNGRTTANSIGSTYELMAEEYGATCSGVDTLDETIQMVLQGRADATLNADVSFFDYMNMYPDSGIKIVAETEEANPIAIPLHKGEDSASLREAVNAALAELHADGTLSALSEKYFGSDISK